MREKMDAELVALARTGDREAFGELIARHYGMAVRLAQRLVAGEECARELVQEAMLQAYLSIGSLRRDGAFRSWLYGIVLNVCRGHLRDQKVEFFSLDTVGGGRDCDLIELADPAADPQEQVEIRDLHRRILAAVGELSPKLRRAALLFYFEQLSVREIAVLLDISVGAVKGRLHRARKDLERWLWPLYEELYLEPQSQRRKTMVKVEIADVVEHDQNSYTVYLLDEEKERYLLVTIGAFEGRALAMGLRSLSLTRPIAYNLTASIMEATGVELLDVRVESLKESIFYAVVRVRSGVEEKELDARPSDAMALAVLQGCPIYVAEEVMEHSAKAYTPDDRENFGQGLDRIEEEHGRQDRERRADQVFHADEAAEDREGCAIWVEFGRVQIDENKAQDLKAGDVLTLDRRAGELLVLYLDGEPKFAGEAVLVDECLALKIKRSAGDAETKGRADKNLSVELGRTYLIDYKAADLGERSVVRLDKKIGDPIDVLVDGRVCARGEVVTVEEYFGVRITGLPSN